MAQRIKAVVSEALEIPFQFGGVTGLCNFLILPGTINNVILGLDILRDIGYCLTIGHEKPKITLGVSRIQDKDWW